MSQQTRTYLLARPHPEGLIEMSALTAACASRLLRRAVGLRCPIEHARAAAAAPTAARALPSLHPSGGEVPFTTSSSSAHDGDADKSGACERKRPGDDGLPIVYHPAYSKPVMPDGHRFCLLYTSPSPRDQRGSRMPSSA